MPTHFWDSDTDFQYCTMDNCSFVSGSVMFSGSSASMVTDIRDSTERLNRYASFVVSEQIPSGTTLTHFWRSGITPTYNSEFWSDWEEIVPGQIITEHVISIFDDRMSVEYIPSELLFVGLERLWRMGVEYINACRTNYAIVNVSRIGAAGSEVNKVGHCTSSNSIVEIFESDSVFDSDTSNVTIRYVPTYPVLGAGSEFVQLKTEMQSTVSGSFPSLSSIELDFRLDVFNRIEREFPLMYRRV